MLLQPGRKGRIQWGIWRAILNLLKASLFPALKLLSIELFFLPEMLSSANIAEEQSIKYFMSSMDNLNRF